MRTKPTIFLAGSSRSLWKHDIQCGFTDMVDFLNEDEYQLHDPTERVLWRNNALQQADVVFAYIEENIDTSTLVDVITIIIQAIHKQLSVILIDAYGLPATLRQQVTAYYNSLDKGQDVLWSLFAPTEMTVTEGGYDDRPNRFQGRTPTGLS